MQTTCTQYSIAANVYNSKSSLCGGFKSLVKLPEISVTRNVERPTSVNINYFPGDV